MLMLLKIDEVVNIEIIPTRTYSQVSPYTNLTVALPRLENPYT